MPLGVGRRQVGKLEHEDSSVTIGVWALVTGWVGMSLREWSQQCDGERNQTCKAKWVETTHSWCLLGRGGTLGHSVMSNSLRPHGLQPARLLFPPLACYSPGISSSRGSFRSRDQICVSCIYCVNRQSLYHCDTWELQGWQEGGILMVVKVRKCFQQIS